MKHTAFSQVCLHYNSLPGSTLTAFEPERLIFGGKISSQPKISLQNYVNAKQLC
jgi:hypothetical protein